MFRSLRALSTTVVSGPQGPAAKMMRARGELGVVTRVPIASSRDTPISGSAVIRVHRDAVFVECLARTSGCPPTTTDAMTNSQMIATASRPRSHDARVRIIFAERRMGCPRAGAPNEEDVVRAQRASVPLGHAAAWSWPVWAAGRLRRDVAAENPPLVSAVVRRLRPFRPWVA